jgi:hypothetical protein
MPTMPSTSLALDPRWRDMLLFVLVVPPVLVVTDMTLLQMSAFTSNFFFWSVTYLWYSLQTAAVGHWVGCRLDRSRWWWGILAWTVLLVDGQVFSFVVPEMGWYDPATSLGFAYASAQIGLAVVWSILGSGNWRTRVPLFIGGFGWAMFLGTILSDEGMMVLLLGQTLATSVCCFALNIAGFRFQKILDPNRALQDRLDKTSQFSIRHLLFWMTIVGMLAAVMRLFDWNSLLMQFRWRDLSTVVWFTLALSMVTMIATWITMGREPWPVRILFGVLALPGVGLAIAYLSGPRTGLSWLFRFIPTWTSLEEWMVMWGIWTGLAGLFLAGLLVVFRSAGLRLMRVAK